MTFASSLYPMLARVRAIPGQLGLRPHTVSVVSRSWSGGQTGEGDETVVNVPIVEADGRPPKVRWLSNEEIALGGLPSGSVQIGPITPSFSDGGTNLSDLDGSDLETSDTRQLRITGPQHPNGALYRVKALNADSALHYTIVAVPAGSSPEP